MDEINVLRAYYDEESIKLVIDIQLNNDFLSLFYSLECDQTWKYHSFFFLKEINKRDYPYHLMKLRSLSTNSEEFPFYDKLRALAPSLLDHPIVRIKAILHK